ncbi:MAG TPA: DUF87 domain-containing protein [Anaeromyxobacteraceae bacterium]|jgi:hypothetical protein|nr:DUF87 domain-containing protein [Anaeromyxobacteraceae bacterium]
MASQGTLAEPKTDAVGLLRAALERRHLDARMALVANKGAPGKRIILFHELIEVAIRDPADVQRSLLELLGSLHSADVNLVFWVHGDGRTLRLRFGVAHAADSQSPHRDALLRRGLEGHLLGSKIEAIEVWDAGRSIVAVVPTHQRCGAILGIPGLSDGNSPAPTLDGALEALAGMRFDLFVYCTPMRDEELDVAESNLALISGQAHLLARQTISSSDAQSFSQSVSKGFSIATGTSDTVNWATSVQHGTSEVVQGPAEEAIGTMAGATLGTVLGGVAGFLTGGPIGVAYGVSIGGSGGAQLGGALAKAAHPQRTESESTTQQEGRSRTTSNTITNTESTADSLGLQLTRQLTLDVVNRQAGLLEDITERHLDRVRIGRGIGMWRTGAHLATSDEATLSVAGQLIIGALRGDGSHLEPLRLVPYTPESMATALLSLREGVEPRISALPHPIVPGAEQPATLLTSAEVGRWIGIPSHDLPGTPAREVVHFGRGGRILRQQQRDETTLALGPLVYGGRVSAVEMVCIPMKDLCGHVFVAGTTGAGKTTTIREVLRGLAERRVPFIVLEPAKSEYLELFEELRAAGHRPIRFELSPDKAGPDVQQLRLNPFAAPSGLPLGRHVEALKILLRSCFEMQESLPQLLEKVLFEVYADRGWKDLVTPITEAEIAARGFPSFADFLEPVTSRRPAAWSRIERAVAEFRYEDRVEKNLVAALTARIESFRRGLKGSVFVREEVSFADLLLRPCFINVSDFNEPDIRRFLLSSLFLRLYAERAAAARRDP